MILTRKGEILTDSKIADLTDVDHSRVNKLRKALPETRDIGEAMGKQWGNNEKQWGKNGEKWGNNGETMRKQCRNNGETM